MHRIITTALSLLALNGAVLAADLPSPPPPVPLPPPPSWTGFYAGLNAGAAFGNSRNTFNIAGFELPSFDIPLRGVIGGVEAGYNWQAGALLLGLEADFDATSMRGSRTAPCIAPLCGALAASYEQKLPWLGTVRPRIGYVLGNWLVFATGGYAFAELDTNANAAFGPFFATNRRSETRNGWTLGGGTEVEFAPHWTAKLEYLYVDLGRDTTTLLSTPLITNKSRVDTNIIRTGVNYRF
jgi:outer membrane immunogenic protein